MANEQQGALTLEALLGLSGEVSGRASGSDAGVLDSASDLLLDLVGSASDPQESSLSLENLPTLPRIPKGSAAEVEGEVPDREAAEQARKGLEESAPERSARTAREAAELVSEPAEPANTALGASEPAESASEPAEPVNKTAKPASESVVPASEPAGTASKTSEPASGVTAPASEPAKPASGVAEPVSESATPAIEPAKPAYEVAQPACEVVEPPREIAQPLREVAKPRREAMEPAREGILEPALAPKPTESAPAAKQEIASAPAVGAKPKVETATPGLAVQAPVPLRESRRMRRGKHAGDEVGDRASCGKHAVRPASSAPAAKPPAPADAPAASTAPIAASPTPTAKPPAPAEAQLAVTPASSAAVASASSEPAPKVVQTRRSRAADARREQLNSLSRKLESKIIAASERHGLNEQQATLPVREQAKRASNPQRDLNDAAKESPMFEERPQSIAEGMREGQREHYRFVRIKIACAAAGLLLLVALVLGAIASLAMQHDAGEGAQDEAQTTSTTGTSSPARPEAESSVSDKPSGSGSNSSEKPTDKPSSNASSSTTKPSTEDRSGTVAYRYVAEDDTEGDRTVTETVEFGKDGLCEKSLMEVEFASNEAAEAFAAGIRRDYGSAALSVEVDGTRVRAEIDASSNGLDREAYEDALRDSVRDLTILKKS